VIKKSANDSYEFHWKAKLLYEIPPVNTVIDAILNTNVIKGFKELWKRLLGTDTYDVGLPFGTCIFFGKGRLKGARKRQGKAHFFGDTILRF
jgi:hypothetical protein